MKKAVPYILGGAVLLVLVVALVASRAKPVRRIDERITLRQRDKIPYGTAVAKHLLPALFPNAEVSADARYPGAWDNLDPSQSNQAVILMADYVNAESDELQRLQDFVNRGNYVFLIARSFSDETANFLKMNVRSFYNVFAASEDDTLLVQLNEKLFSADSLFAYPGKKYEGIIQYRDTAKALMLGDNGYGSANFVQMNTGRGSFFVHTSPLAFSNYFILHRQNVAYYQQALSVIPKDVKAVVWNEYFLQKVRKPENNPNWLAALFSVPAFKWGFLTALLFLLLYILQGMRRKQRAIPPHEKPKNDSLDFVTTLGRLYYDRGDHRNLAEKMGVYFLEHVRSTYKMTTHTLDAGFVRTLHVKSGYPEPEINGIITEIKSMGEEPNISEERLAHFHRQLELFYQNT